MSTSERPPNTLDAAGTVKAGACGYLIAALLCAPDMLPLAERQPLGPLRDLGVALATRWNVLARATRLDAPHRAIAAWLRPREATALPTDLAGDFDLAAPLPTTRPSTGRAPGSPSAPATGSPRRTPVRIYSAGDSMAWVFGQELARIARRDNRYRVVFDSRHSSGLIRRDFFDWPKRIREVVAANAFDAVIVTFGTNDAECFRVDGARACPGTAPWQEQYAGRIRDALDVSIGAPPARRLFWIGLPITRSEALARRLQVANDLFRREVSARREAIFIETWSLFTDRQNAYSAWLPDDEGHETLMREADGVHYTRAGARRLAERVRDVLDGLYFPGEPGSADAR